jgi:hypothetical protein
MINGVVESRRLIWAGIVARVGGMRNELKFESKSRKEEATWKTRRGWRTLGQGVRVWTGFI